MSVNVIYEVNNRGRQQIRKALQQHHTKGFFTDSQVRAWAEDVENNLCEGNGAYFEIPGFNTVSGRPEVIYIDDKGITKHESEADDE
jgi:hypothetical protein